MKNTIFISCNIETNLNGLNCPIQKISVHPNFIKCSMWFYFFSFIQKYDSQFSFLFHIWLKIIMLWIVYSLNKRFSNTHRQYLSIWTISECTKYLLNGSFSSYRICQHSMSGSLKCFSSTILDSNFKVLLHFNWLGNILMYFITIGDSPL